MSEQDNPTEKMFLFSMMHNLDWNIGFHRELNRLMRNEVASIDQDIEKCTDSNDTFELNFRKSALIDHYDSYTLNNLFLMQWSLLEEIMYHTHKLKYQDISLPQTRSFKTYKPIFKAKLSNLSSYKPWNFLIRATEVRNCLLHANGRIKLSKNPEWLEKEFDKNQSLYKLINQRVFVTAEFINQLNRHAKTILNDLIN